MAALTASFVACGPSKEEIEMKEKAKADSGRCLCLHERVEGAPRARPLQAPTERWAPHRLRRRARHAGAALVQFDVCRLQLRPAAVRRPRGT